MQIEGKTAIVTGAASGIGRATALQLARRGASDIAIVDIDRPGLEDTAHQVHALGARPSLHRLDLADREATAAWFGQHGAVDILHNNAGVVAGAAAFPDAPVARLGWIIEVNLTSLVIATQIVAGAMQARGGGTIVNTVSTVALGTGFPDAMYATTKAGVMMFTRCCAGLHPRWNVRVLGLLPGLTDTPILARTGDDRPADWMAPVLANNERCTPDDLADAAILLIEDDARVGGSWVAVRRIDGQVTHQWGSADTL